MTRYRPSFRTRTIRPTILSPSGLDVASLDSDALRSLQRMQARGFEAYLVGGCVRDLLLGRKPKDFDMATGARPAQIKRTFPRNCRIIGRRFKLAHLHFDNNRKIIEVSTFRRAPLEETGDSQDLLITQDNEFGNAEEDAVRRDFTVNALFFDPVRNEIIDYVDGLADIQNRLLRTIGSPVVRFREDPVRILRAAKFAGRLGLKIDDATWEAMAQVAPDLTRSAAPRILEEVLRLLRGGHALDSFQILRDIGALKVMLPVVGDFLARAPEAERVLFWRILESLDARVEAGHAPSTPVLLGALFVRPVLQALADGGRRSPATITEEMLGGFARDLRLSRRDAGCVKRICAVQPRFHGNTNRRFKTSSFLLDPYFPEAMALFEMTVAATGEGLDTLEEWRQQAADVRSDMDYGAEDPSESESGSPHGERGAAARWRTGQDPDQADLDPSEDTDGRSEGRDDRELPVAFADEDSDEEHGAGHGNGPSSPFGESVPTADSEQGDPPGRKRRRRRRRRGRGDRPGDAGDTADSRPGNEAMAEDQDLLPPDRDLTDEDHAEATPAPTDGPGSSEEVPRRRRRRRRKSRAGELAGEFRGPEGDSRDPDLGPEVTPPEWTDEEEPFTGPDLDHGERAMEPREETSEDSDAERMTADRPGEGPGGGPGGGSAGGRRRKRRGRRKPREEGGATAPIPHRDPEGAGAPGVEGARRSQAREDRGPARPAGRGPGSQGRREAPPAHRQRIQPAPGQGPGGGRGAKAPPGKDRGDDRGGRSGRRDKPDRRNKRHDGHRPTVVEEIEPVLFDRSMFDLELDPRRVPTFGVLVDDKSGKRKRRPPPSMQEEKGEGYRPPPAPGNEPSPAGPPPPPPPVDDTFGDW